ncbi:MAG: glycerol-3-phosphate dehydrogenase [Candidatus Aenigmatarchaeota archaeon]|nr:MAG: glycerol-3-phosphate dehydrogenase [Candidatus Aenigmarchaeota archaeon]
MRVSVLGAGAMGSALTVPLCDNGVEVCLWGTEYDTEILKKIENGEEHPRIGVKLPDVEVVHPEKLDYALDGADVVVLAVSTVGVVPVFRRIKDYLNDEALITISKGLLEADGKVVTIPEAIWKEKEYSDKTVAITGPSIAREVAHRLPTKVLFSSAEPETAERMADLFSTDYYRVEVSDDIKGAEITAALKNVYSIGISWVRGYEQSYDMEMDNLRGVIASMALDEIGRIVEAYGGRRETVYGLSGFGDVIATFKGGRNGMLGELLGRGLSIEESLDELKRRGVGVIEGYVATEKAYRLVKELEDDGKLSMDDLTLFMKIYQVLYENGKVKDALEEILR